MDEGDTCPVQDSGFLQRVGDNGTGGVGPGGSRVIMTFFFYVEISKKEKY